MEVGKMNQGALWINKNPDKKTAMYGNVCGKNVIIFENKNKKSDKDPDYVVMLSYSQAHKGEE